MLGLQAEQGTHITAHCAVAATACTGVCLQAGQLERLMIGAETMAMQLFLLAHVVGLHAQQV